MLRYVRNALAGSVPTPALLALLAALSLALCSVADPGAAALAR